MARCEKTVYSGVSIDKIDSPLRNLSLPLTLKTVFLEFLHNVKTWKVIRGNLGICSFTCHWWQRADHQTATSDIQSRCQLGKCCSTLLKKKIHKYNENGKKPNFQKPENPPNPWSSLFWRSTWYTFQKFVLSQTTNNSPDGAQTGQ